MNKYTINYPIISSNLISIGLKKPSSSETFTKNTKKQWLLIKSISVFTSRKYSGC